MSMILVGILCMLTGLQLHVKPGEHRHKVPLDLEKGVALSWAQGAESHHWMLDCFAILVEDLLVAETVILEYL